MSDPISSRSKHGQTLRNKFELEKRRLSYTDFHHQDVKTRLHMTPSPSPSTQTEKVGNKDEIVRHMSNLPSYLETRKHTPDNKALNFGVMDWGKLQKYQYQHVNKYSPSSSNSSPLFSTERSTPQSTVGQRLSYSGQRPPRVTLQSYFNTPSCSTNVTKFQDFHSSKVLESDSSRNSAPLKGKMKIPDPFSSEKDEKNRFYQKSNTFEVKRPSFSSKNSDINSGSFTPSKLRSMSPIRRLSFSNTKRTDNNNNNTRVSSSPLRRLFEPLFQPKSTNSEVDLKYETCESATIRQALFQSVIKNGRPLFTFAIENNNNILAATVRDLTSSTKDNSSRWIYTFFTVDEIKKKNMSWLSRKDKGGHGYAPNVTAQMTVTNRSIYNSDTREFSLFRVNPYDEHAAIVVKFLRSVECEEERFSTTVVLPGGNHGVSSNGKPSPLIDRWRSGGVCDCGGWDLGCRLRILTNQVQSDGRLNSSNGQFELFFQGDIMNKKHFFNLCPIKDGLFSVEFNSSVSPLQAFSICISVVECRKSSQHQESTTYVAKRVPNDPNPVRFASFPPLSPVGRV